MEFPIELSKAIIDGMQTDKDVVITYSDGKRVPVVVRGMFEDPSGIIVTPKNVRQDKWRTLRIKLSELSEIKIGEKIFEL